MKFRKSSHKKCNAQDKAQDKLLFCCSFLRIIDKNWDDRIGRNYIKDLGKALARLLRMLSRVIISQFLPEPYWKDYDNRVVLSRHVQLVSETVTAHWFCELKHWKQGGSLWKLDCQQKTHEQRRNRLEQGKGKTNCLTILFYVVPKTTHWKLNVSADQIAN